MRLTPELSERAQALIASRLGLDFPENRRADLARGLVRAFRASSLSTLENYLARLAAAPDGDPEWGRLASHLTVGETYFFRDRPMWEALEREVLPSLIAARRAEGLRRLRLWSAGCATGEEPYSLAILLDRLLPDRADWAVTILATDVNPDSLTLARAGIYRKWSFRETPPEVQGRYFRRRGADGFELDRQVRRTVSFAPLNLAEDAYPAPLTNTGAMDLILCRNVLMYFTRPAQRAAVGRFRMALVPGGWLVVSPAEGSADGFKPLVPVSFPGAVLYRKEPAAAVAGLASPAGAEPRSWTFQVLPGAPVEAAGEAAEPAPVPPPVEPPLAQCNNACLTPAVRMADGGRLEEARRLCEAVLARDRLNTEGYLLLAAICQEQGELPPALAALRRAIYLAPDSAPAHFLLGALLLRQGQASRGRRAMETVVKLLTPFPPDEVLAGGEGLTAGRLLETARSYLEVGRPGRTA